MMPRLWRLTDFFNASPGDSGASFWNGGAGPAADEQGNIFVVSANGDFDGDAALAEYDESVLQVHAGAQVCWPRISSLRSTS